MVEKVTGSPVGHEGDCNSAAECVADPIATMIVAGGDAPPGIAAVRFEELLAEIRTDTPDGSGDLVGVVVTVRMELSGLRGKPLLLWWQMFAADSDVRVFHPWLRTTPVYHLQTTKNEVTASVNLWIPLPNATGPYRVQVGLSLKDPNSLPLAAGHTEPFDQP